MYPSKDIGPFQEKEYFEEVIIMKKSMLTYETLDRFETLVNVSTLTEDQIKVVEHCAYCANMGAKDKDAAWSWFCHLINKYLQISIQ